MDIYIYINVYNVVCSISGLHWFHGFSRLASVQFLVTFWIICRRRSVIWFPHNVPLSGSIRVLLGVDRFGDGGTIFSAAKLTPRDWVSLTCCRGLLPNSKKPSKLGSTCFFFNHSVKIPTAVSKQWHLLQTALFQPVRPTRCKARSCEGPVGHPPWTNTEGKSDSFWPGPRRLCRWTTGGAKDAQRRSGALVGWPTELGLLEGVFHWDGTGIDVFSFKFFIHLHL